MAQKWQLQGFAPSAFQLQPVAQDLDLDIQIGLVVGQQRGGPGRKIRFQIAQQRLVVRARFGIASEEPNDQLS